MTTKTLIRLQFKDLLNRPLPNLYHEVRRPTDKYAISAGNSNDQGYGVWIEQPVGTQLNIAVKDPKTKAMTTLRTQIVVPSKKSTMTVLIQAPYYKEHITLQPRQGTQGSYLRKTHTVKKGETLEGIAKQYNTTWQVLYQLNKDKIKDPNKISVGLNLKIPPKSSGLRQASNAKTSNGSSSPKKSSNPYTKPKITTANYQVEQGDTLGSIAQRSGKSIADLQRINGIKDPNKIKTGQTIKTGLPAQSTKPTSTSSHTSTTKTSTTPTTQNGGILDSITGTIQDGIDWLDKTTQPIQDKTSQVIDEGSKTMGKVWDTASNWLGSDDSASSPPSQNQSGQAQKQAKLPTSQPIQTKTQDQRSQNEDGTPKVVVSTKGDCVCQVYDLIWGAHPNVTCEFRKKVVEICKELWPDNYLQMANNLMAVFAWESGETFKADAPNQADSGGTGLIQIMPDTYRGLARKMGLKNTEPTMEYVSNYWKNGKRLKRIKQLAQMSEIEQLDWVKQYFMPHKGKKLEFIDFYLQVLFPVSSGLPEHVVFANSLNKLDRMQERQDLKQKRVNAFAKNNMDQNGDGRVMKSEIAQSVEHYLKDGKKLQKIKQCSVNPVIVKPSNNTCLNGNNNCLCQGLKVQNGIVKNSEVIQAPIKQNGLGSMKCRAIVLHRTAGGSAMSSIDWGNQKGYGAHFYIDNQKGQDGQIYQATPITSGAYHMGVAQYQKTKEAGIGNHTAIGIEVAGLYSEPTKRWENLTEKQAKSTACLLLALMRHFNLTYDQVHFHEDLCSKTAYEGRMVWIAIKKYLPNPPTGNKYAPYRPTPVKYDPRFPEE